MLPHILPHILTQLLPQLLRFLARAAISVTGNITPIQRVKPWKHTNARARVRSLVVAHRGFFLAFGAVPLLVTFPPALKTC